jgi:polysaccharide export outer membrane protein
MNLENNNISFVLHPWQPAAGKSGDVEAPFHVEHTGGATCGRTRKRRKLNPASGWFGEKKTTSPNHQLVQEVQTDIRGPSPGRSGHACDATVPLVVQGCLCRRWVHCGSRCNGCPRWRGHRGHDDASQTPKAAVALYQRKGKLEDVKVMGRGVHSVVVVLILLMVSACASNPAGPSTSSNSVSKAGSSAADKPEMSGVSKLVGVYRIGVDDVVKISVWRNPELSVTVPVRPDGKISMPLIGDVSTGGHTTQEVAQEIQKRLSAYIRDPQVAVIVSQLRSNEYLSRIRVTGAVRAPVSLPYRRGMTVLDCVLAAGGINEFAAPNRTKLYRKHRSGKTEVIKIKLGDILTRGRLATNVALEPGDVVTVPERLF